MSDVKATISSSYMASQLIKYGDLKYRPESERSCLIVGAKVEGHTNIGGYIIHALADYYVESFDKSLGDAGNPEFVDQILHADASYDTLVCCQGTTHLDWIENQTPADIARQVHDSMMSHMIMVNKFVQNTIDKPYRKCIVLIGSMAYRQILNGSSIYCAAKAGLNMFGRCIAWELAPKGYDVYIVHPGNVANSPMAEQTIKELQRYRNMDEESAALYWNTGNPRNTILTPMEIARLVRVLVSGKYQYLAGNPIDLTGGQR